MMNKPFANLVTPVVEALARTGVKTSDIVLFHSSLSSLGTVEKKDVPKLCEALFNGLMELLGPNGTLLVPAYFYEYARFGIPFDVKLSPVSKNLGVFAAYVTGRKDAIRSKNPTTCMAAVGAKAEYLCANANP